MDEFFLIRELKTEIGGIKYEPVLVRGEIFERGIKLEGGVTLSCPFSLKSFKFGDLLLVTYDESTQELLPYPRTPQEANPAQDPIILDAAENRKKWAKDGSEKLIVAVQEMRAAISEGRLTDALIQKWNQLKQQFVDATTSALDKVHIKVNFTTMERIYSPVTLLSRTGKAKNINAFVDSGADSSVIHPNAVRELGLEPDQKGIIESMTEGSSEVPLVNLTVKLPNGFSIEIIAAVYAPVREKTASDFLMGRDVILPAKKAGVSLI